jgi:hypothetical protein
MRLTTAFTLVSLSVVAAASAQHFGMPPGMTHEEHLAQMKKDVEMKQHGQMAMGFDQDAATHHFTLATNGGAIALSANDAADQMTREQIRTHLNQIAHAFGRGDFQAPFLTHSEMPPGVATMQRLKAQITYTFEPTERGGVVRITTANTEALNAVHQFLRYQINEHKTGDPITVEK